MLGDRALPIPQQLPTRRIELFPDRPGPTFQLSDQRFRFAYVGQPLRQFQERRFKVLQTEGVLNLPLDPASLRAQGLGNLCEIGDA